jgi:YegS/Rv2252/BmrU family lipid kinase
MLPVILNAGSGSGLSEAEVERVRRSFQEAGIDAELLLAREGGDIGRLAREALKSRPPVVVAGGGDGTLNAVAEVLRGTDTALGILPLGTLNHFAKDLGIPLELDAAVRTIAAGRRMAVDAGDVNGKCFLNNSSLGLYPDAVRERKQQQHRLGRSKRAATIWATLAALGRARLLDLRLQLEDREHACRAPFVFIGNNQYQMEGFNIGTRERLDAGRLSIYTTQRCTTGGLVMLLLHALFGRLKQARDFTALRARILRVETPQKRLRVATDGEVSVMETPLQFEIRPRSLNVIVP